MLGRLVNYLVNTHAKYVIDQRKMFWNWKKNLFDFKILANLYIWSYFKLFWYIYF